MAEFGRMVPFKIGDGFPMQVRTEETVAGIPEVIDLVGTITAVNEDGDILVRFGESAIWVPYDAYKFKG